MRISVMNSFESLCCHNSKKTKKMLPKFALESALHLHQLQAVGARSYVRLRYHLQKISHHTPNCIHGISHRGAN
jgi:hypothetical protein